MSHRWFYKWPSGHATEMAINEKRMPMTPIQQAQEVIDKYQWSLYSVPYCVEVMSGLVKRIRDLEDQLELTRAASNVEPM
jgi:hypothetical protein